MTWREKIEGLLTEELGMLASVILDEILEELKIKESQVSGHYGSKFIKLLEKKTANDIQNPKLIRQVYKIILDLPY